jgi:small subunit ribosomal protein S1
MFITPQTMEELLASELAELRPVRVGETVEGIVATIGGDEATIDLGERPAGVIPTREAGARELRVGQTITARVIQAEGPDGRVVLSLRRARGRHQWDQMAELQRSGKLIEAEVIDANRGGVVVDVGMRGFVPLSQLVSIGAIAASDAGIPEPVRALVGKRLRLRVLDVDPTRDRLILSEKAAAHELRRARKAQGSARLTEGDVLEGTVASITSYGVFVDVGVADGLVHRSEITWSKGVEPTSLVTVGQRVRVMVVGVDHDRQRISLSLRRLVEDPWERFARQPMIGSTVSGRITRVMPYGAFARVADGVEGLIHVSELAAPGVAQADRPPRVGDELPVKIVGIDAERRRLSLSARLAEGT